MRRALPCFDIHQSAWLNQQGSAKLRWEPADTATKVTIAGAAGNVALLTWNRILGCTGGNSTKALNRQRRVGGLLVSFRNVPHRRDCDFRIWISSMAFRQLVSAAEPFIVPSWRC